MGHKIVFIGEDHNFYQKLTNRFTQTYSGDEFSFKTITDLKSLDVKKVFLEIFDYKPDIIYIDFSAHVEDSFSLAKFISKNNELRQKATVGLFDYPSGMKLIKKTLNSELRLYHFKSLEINDLVFGPMSIVDINHAENRDYSHCSDVGDVEIQLPARVGYIEDNHFHIETNSYLEENEIIDISTHPLVHIMPSTKVFVYNFQEQGLYFNKRFSYDLEFIYIDNDYFTSTNKNWLLYKELKEDPEKMNQLDKHIKLEIQEDMKRRKKVFRPTRNKIDQWLSTRTNKSVPKKLKIMIIDKTLLFIREVKGKLENFPYSLNVQSQLMSDNYQLRRTLPHLIILKFDETNNEEVIQGVIKTIKEIKNYDPFVLISGYPDKEEPLKVKLDYKQLMIYSDIIHVEEIRKMATILDEKMKISNAKQKVFISSHDENSLMMIRKNVHISELSESEAYFEYDHDIPMWTVFVVDHPISMLFTVIPKKDDDKYKNDKNIYRALINGVGELEKAELRKWINLAIARNNED